MANANVITVNGPKPADYIQHFVEQFIQDRQAREDQKTKQRQLDIQQQQANQSGTYEQGLIGNAQDTFRAGRTDKEIEDFVDNAVKPYFGSGRPEDFAIAKANVEKALAEHPDWKDRLIGFATRAASSPLPSDTANANTSKFAADQTGVAASGSQDVQARAFTQERALGRPMSPQQFGDQQQRQPEAATPPKGTKPSAYTESLMIGSDRAPGATAKLKADTDIKTTGMQTASAERQNAARIEASATSAKNDQAQLIAQEIIAGRQPPVVSRAMEGPVRAALAENKYDLMKATQDWTATQKYLSTLNGSGQVRLRQAVDFASESLGVVQDLAQQWQGGGFPIVNHMQLQAAKQGAMGPKAQALATKLDSQITEMQSELAVVYRGGNSPTDEALKSAAKVLQSNWSLPTLMANVDLLRQNLQIRRNSITSAGIVTNQANQYAPKTGPGGNAAPGADPLGLFGGKP